MTAKEGFPRLLQRIQLALGEQNKFKNKVNEYNESLDQVRRNLEQIIKPADTIKSKLPSYADKLKRHTELKEKLDNLINKKVLYTTAEIEAIVIELIKDDEVKLLIEELVRKTELNNLDDVREFIKNLKDEGTLSKPQEIKEVLDEILKQGKIAAEEEEQLRNEMRLDRLNVAKIINKNKIKLPPQYWVQVFKDEINKNNFSRFIGIDNQYGLYTNANNNYCMGTDKININYDKSTDNVNINIPNKFDFNFSPDGFIELFGTLEPNIVSVTRQDFINYAQLLKETGVKDFHSLHLS